MKLFRKRFGSKVITHNAIRSFNDVAPFWFKHVSPYKKGEDVLIDTLLLSKCDYLLKGAAAVGEMALWFNENLECTDFALESQFVRKPYYLLESAYLKMNIGGKSSFTLKIWRYYRICYHYIQSTFPKVLFFRLFLFLRKLK